MTISSNNTTTNNITNLAMESLISVEEIHFSQYKDPHMQDDDSIAGLDFDVADKNNKQHSTPKAIVF